MEFPNDIPIDPTWDSGCDYSSRSSDFTTDSLTSSVYAHRYQYGRRYQAFKDGKYMYPNDEKEQDRLDIVHHTYLIGLDDELTLAPIGENPQWILDVGTGTGIWAIDAGERWPSATVIGTDVSPIQPSWVPPNVEFQIDDAEKDWTFKRDHFDLIHIRSLGGAIEDWDRLVEQAYLHCKPGGWIDMCDYEMDVFSDDGTLENAPELSQFYHLVSEAAKKTGRGFDTTPVLKPIIEKTGFINVQHQELKVPIGPWAADKKQKELGAYILLSAESGFEAFGIQLFTGVLGMDVEEAQDLIRKTLKHAKSSKIHSYAKYHFYWGQKPLDEDEDEV